VRVGTSPTSSCEVRTATRARLPTGVTATLVGTPGTSTASTKRGDAASERSTNPTWPLLASV
jgi:hypothetical protein